MKNKKIIALICALTVASVGIGVLASQAEPISDAYAAEQEEQTEELSVTKGTVSLTELTVSTTLSLPQAVHIMAAKRSVIGKT